jgi:DNA primase
VGARAPLPDDAREVRDALTDPRALCDALGLLDGPRSWARQARGVIVRCPWHDERTPSCSVYLGDDGTIAAKCHGCGASGDALSLVAAVSGLDPRRDFAAVLDEAARIAGVRLSSPSTGYTSTRPAPAPRPAPAARERGLEPLGDDAFAELADALLELCPVEREADALAYLEDRGVAALATGWGALPADRDRIAAVRDALVARFGRETWLRCGLAHGDGPRAGDWLFAEHRLVIPWRAAGVSGSVLSLQRRLLRAPSSPREPKYVVTRGRAATVPFGCEDALEELGEGVEVCVVEGALDALAMRLLARRARRARAVVAIPGVEHWAKHLAQLGALARGRVAVVALDADAAGERHVGELAAELVKAGATRVVRSRPTAGKDWCDVLLEKSR